MSIPLSRANLKQVFRIEKFLTNHHMAQLLWEIGVTPNRLYQVKSKLSCGKVIIGNDSFKVALDRMVAEQIMVKVSL